MSKRALYARIFGLLGTAACVAVFMREPSWPTPDKLLVFATLAFMGFGQGWQLFKHLGPFVGLLLVYESFRGVADHLNSHVNYGFMTTVDSLAHRVTLPTVALQNVLWHGHVQWYDFVFYGAYMLHFVLPLGLAILVYKLKPRLYWQYVATYMTLSFSAFISFALFPAAPPWMASQDGFIAPITRISSQVWAAFGIRDFPSVYNKISPNAVAAMPSLHAAYATLFTIFIYKLFGKKWAALSLVYPALIWFGTVYQGEHYAIDELAGIVFALAAYKYTPYVLAQLKQRLQGFMQPPALVPVMLYQLSSEQAA
jgi:hypothetical protein